MPIEWHVTKIMENKKFCTIGASWCSLGGVLGISEASWEPSWALHGPSWRPFEASGAMLEPSWSPLERMLVFQIHLETRGRLGTIPEAWGHVRPPEEGPRQ